MHINIHRSRVLGRQHLFRLNFWYWEMEEVVVFVDYFRGKQAGQEDAVRWKEHNSGVGISSVEAMSISEISEGRKVPKGRSYALGRSFKVLVKV